MLMFPEEIFPFSSYPNSYPLYWRLADWFRRVRRPSAWGGLTSSNFVTFREIRSDIRMDIMARTKRNTNTQTTAPKTRKSSATKWINVNLDDGDVAAIEEMFPDEHTTAAWFLELCSQAEHVYVRYDDDKESASAGMIGRDYDGDGQTYGLSGWSSDTYNAIRSLLYKWHVKLERQWPEGSDNAPLPFR